METFWFTHYKEISDKTISWEDHSNGVLGFEGNFAHRLCHTGQQSRDAYAVVLHNLKAIKEK
jgi:hypothetical protein